MHATKIFLAVFAVFLNFYGHMDHEWSKELNMLGLAQKAPPRHPADFLDEKAADVERGGQQHSQEMLTFKEVVERRESVPLGDEAKALSYLKDLQGSLEELIELKQKNFTLSDRKFMLECEWPLLKFNGAAFSADFKNLQGVVRYLFYRVRRSVYAAVQHAANRHHNPGDKRIGVDGGSVVTLLL